MQLFDALQAANLDGAWLTIGAYDGVHRGHQAILKQLSREAHAAGAAAALLTFYPHPSEVLRGPQHSFYLTTPEEKKGLVANYGLDALVTQAFSRELSQTRAEDFVAQLKAHLGLRQLWVGEDFALGHERRGDVSADRKSVV